MYDEEANEMGEGLSAEGQAMALGGDPCNDHEIQALHQRLIAAGAAAAQPRSQGPAFDDGQAPAEPMPEEPPSFDSY